jgi:uncharacterized protein YbjQ (UPF0145 family)
VCTTPGCELVGIPADGPYCDRCGSLLELLETPQRHDGSEVAPSPVLVVTTNDVPGYRITKVHGDVFGLIVRAGNYFSNLGARMHTLVGGEVAGYTSLLIDSRNEARARLMDSARSAGANAVVAFRFDCNEIGGIMSEIAAYGTAVTVVPLDGGSSAGSPSLREG